MSFVTWLPSAIALVLFLGAAAVYLKGSRDKGTIETLERNNKALNERVDILEAARATDRTENATLKETVRVLEKTANSGDQIAELKADLHDHHSAAMESLEQIHIDLAGLPLQLAQAMKGHI